LQKHYRVLETIALQADLDEAALLELIDSAKPDPALTAGVCLHREFSAEKIFCTNFQPRRFLRLCLIIG
jgi:hypothetical protein